MSEVTVETGELAVCINCQLKHAVGLLHHVDPLTETQKYSKTIELIKEIGQGLMMTSQEVEDFIAVHKLEHKVEDALTVLRDLRHKIMEGSEERFEALEAGGNPGNPGNRMILEHCEFTKEPVKPKGYFDHDSFRTICPECPEQRCALCPPEFACSTRIITGCKEGEFVNGRCQVGTEAHVIYHTKGAHNPGNPDGNPDAKCIKIDGVGFCQDTEDAYTDIGKAGKIWRGSHKGFDITVYPVALLDSRVEGWEYSLYNEKKEVDWDSLAETSTGGDHAKDAKQAMKWAKTTVEEWE